MRPGSRQDHDFAAEAGVAARRWRLLAGPSPVKEDPYGPEPRVYKIRGMRIICRL